MVKMRSVMSHQFSQIPKVQIPRSVFNRSHGYKTTFDSGYLVPFFVDEALPGDTFDLQASLFSRLTTPIVPIMDNMFLETFFFAVPYRLLWDNWQRFNGEQTDPGDSTDFLIPQVTAPTITPDPPDPPIVGWQVGSLSDYMGIPTGVDISVSALWHRAYNLIWNEWFRDQNLQDSVPVPRGDGPDAPSNYQLLRRGKRHDYFTSCLPWPQKGPGVELPLSGDAPVYGSGHPLRLTDGTLERTLGGSYTINSPSGNALGTISAWESAVGPAGDVLSYGDKIGDALPSGNSVTDVTFSGVTRTIGVADVNSVAPAGLVADLSAVTAATINSLRTAFQLQKLLEKDARGGTRYTEIIRSHFGVISPDARMQRPEYLGGSSTRIIINPVQQTSSTDATTPQGNLAAFGIASDSFHGFSKSFTEHSVIIGLLNVRADLTYQDGLNRMFSRRTRWDHYWPSLAHLGEQAVLNKEIYCQGTSDDDDVFGYQERWAEYRYFPSKITGLFRSSHPQSLDVWHLSQEFANLPVLNDEFIVDEPPVDRVIAVPSQPQFLLDCYINLRCARPMPVYSVPGLIDHF